MSMPERCFTWGQCLKYEEDPMGGFIKKTYDLPKSCTNRNAKGSKIQEFFNGAHVLITGSTGFMGKGLLEKLIASCPKLEKLYLLIREKKGKSPDQRFNELFQDKMFTRIHQTVPDFRNKVVAVYGDCSQLKLGMSEEDYNNLSEKINVIFHSAATVRFDEKLRIATHINVRGVREMLSFAKHCQNLKSFVHISTAYANCSTKLAEIEEKFYTPTLDYKALIDLVEEQTEDMLERITPGILGDLPNTYAFTKQVGEDVVRQEGKNLPIVIYRPGIVIASYKEPVRGWCDNIFGPTGTIFGAATGVLRVMPGDAEQLANLVPVDYAINGTIAAACQAHTNFKEKKGTVIYNYVSTKRGAITWGEFSIWCEKYGRKWPTMLSIWYPMLIHTKNSLLFHILSFILHMIPAYLGDLFLYLSGRQTMLIKSYRKISKFLGVIAYFGTNFWMFHDDNVLELWKSLSKEDKEIYPFDVADLDWDYHSHGHLLGLRTYLVKEPLETLPAARIKYRRLFAQHVAVIVIVVCILLWTLSRIIGWSFQ